MISFILDCLFSSSSEIESEWESSTEEEENEEEEEEENREADEIDFEGIYDMLKWRDVIIEVLRYNLCLI